MNTENKIQYCECGSPMAKRLGSRKIETMARHHGQIRKEIINHNGNECTVTCKKCDYTLTFGVGVKYLSLSYEVALPK